MSEKKKTDRLKAAISAVELPRAEAVVQPDRIQDVELWQIVVAGAIDPRQHHHAWYHLNGFINDEEMIIAGKTAVIISGPHPMINHVQFDAGEFAIICTPDRWIIQTTKWRAAARIHAVAASTFAKLDQLFISAYGINRVMLVDLDGLNANEVLAEKLSHADLELSGSKKTECQIVHTEHSEGSDTTIHLLPSSSGDNLMRVNFNRHHPIKKSETVVHFDLGDLLKIDVELDWEAAEGYKLALSKALHRKAK